MTHEMIIGSDCLSFFLLFLLGVFKFREATATTVESVAMFGHEGPFTTSGAGPSFAFEFPILSN